MQQLRDGSRGLLTAHQLGFISSHNTAELTRVPAVQAQKLILPSERFFLFWPAERKTMSSGNRGTTPELEEVIRPVRSETSSLLWRSNKPRILASHLFKHCICVHVFVYYKKYLNWHEACLSARLTSFLIHTAEVAARLPGASSDGSLN